MNISLSNKRRAVLEDENANAYTTKRSRKEAELSQTQVNLTQQGYESPYRCGKILQMHLTNFMCHSNLSIEFFPRINFLVGNNGSGKSAVLAALTVGLGAKARATKRSNNIRQFIKTGETSAKIEITILNEGPDGYETEVYGDRIIVVRNISQSSVSFTIKNQSGRVISKKAEDLQRILMYLNMQVDNPVFILNQDSAREFLKDLDPKKNYELFMKATQLDMVMEKLNDCTHAHADHKYRIKCFRKKLLNTQGEVAELKNKLADVLSLREMEERVQRLEVELHWAKVEEHERALAKLAGRFADIEGKCGELQEMIDNRDKTKRELEQRISSLKGEADALNKAYLEENATGQQLRSEKTKVTENCNTADAYVQNYKKKIALLKQQIKELEDHMRASNQLVDIAEMRKQNEEKIEELRKSLKESEAIIENAMRDVNLFRTNQIQLSENLTKLTNHKTKLVYDRQRLESQISNLRSTSKDKLSVYGPDVLRLLPELQMLHKAGKFERMPRGPIGQYIEVPNSRYRDVVEHQLGSLLNVFIVHCSKDREAFQELLRTKYPNYKPTLITTKFFNQVYDVSAESVTPPRHTRLLMDEIRCTDPVVMNCLIDRAQIETVLLCDTKEVAEQLTEQLENVPRNMKRAIVVDAGLEYYPDPKYRVYSMRIKGARFIQVNAEERICQLTEECHVLKEKLTTALAERSTAEEQLRSNQKSLEEKRLLAQKYEQVARDTKRKITELVEFEYPQQPEEDVLKRELKNMEEKVRKTEAEKEAKIEELSILEIKRESLKKSIAEQEEKKSRITEKINSINALCSETSSELNSMENKLRRIQTKIDEYNQQLAKLNVAKGQLLENLEQIMSKALELGERVTTERSEEEIVEEIKKCKAKLKHRAEIEQDPEYLKKIIESKEFTLAADKATCENICRSVQMLKESLTKRFSFIRSLKQHMAMVFQFSFNTLLSMRSFVGSVELNFNERTLNLVVIPRDNHLQNAVSSTKALSGGERSFTTVAFLLALWSCVDHPFYFLDEYDVFTDEVNREYITRLLIEEGKNKPSRQYTFLTPLDTAIKASDIIKIHQLAPPESM